MKYFQEVRYKKYLNSSDYIKRADYLAWEGTNTGILKRMLKIFA